MTKSRKLGALLAAAVLSVTFAACGSDDEDSPSGDSAKTQAKALSPKDYIQTVNEVQSEFASEAGKLNLANPSSPGDFKKSLEELLVLLDTLVEDLDAAEPPKEVTAEHDELVDTLRDYGELVEDNKEGLVSEDQAEIRSSATKIGEGSTEFSQTFDAKVKEINDKLGIQSP